MNVGELKKAIELLPDDHPVLVSSDAEGNRIRLLAEAERGLYVMEGPLDAEVVHLDDADEYPDAGVALVLWPV